MLNHGLEVPTDQPMRLDKVTKLEEDAKKVEARLEADCREMRSGNFQSRALEFKLS